jgi:hypothetical protein
MDPDPGGPKTRGVGGSVFGSATLVRSIFIYIFLNFPTNWNGVDLAPVDLVIAGHQDPGHHRVPEHEETEFHNKVILNLSHTEVVRKVSFFCDKKVYKKHYMRSRYYRRASCSFFQWLSY